MTTRSPPFKFWTICDPLCKKNSKGGFSAHSGAKKAQKWGFSKKLSKNPQIKGSQVICDQKSQLFMSQFLNFKSETKIVKITHSANLMEKSPNIFVNKKQGSINSST